MSKPRARAKAGAIIKVVRLALALAVTVSGLVSVDGALARSNGRSGGARSGHQHSGSHHRHHSRSRVFVGAFVAAPAVWPYWDSAAYAGAPPPVHYVERSNEGDGEWLYCSEANAYFPYVSECAAGWQSVRPQLPPG